MKGILAVYLIFLLLFPGCMMAPMMLLPALTEKLQTRQESTATPRQEQGQMASRQNQGGENSGAPPK